MAMPLNVNYATFCIVNHEPKCLEDLAVLCGRQKVIDLLTWLSTNGYAEISRIRYGTKSGFGIVIHYGTMNCGGKYSNHSFRPFASNKDMVCLPFNKGFASFTNHHTAIKVAVKEEEELEDDYTIFCRRAMKQIVANNPGRTVNTTGRAISVGSKVLRQLNSIDGFSLGYIMDVICWGLQDSFWKGNIYSMSPMRARSKNNDLRKFENISNAYVVSGGGNKRVREFGEVTTNKVNV
jgi:hypothetical protein